MAARRRKLPTGDFRVTPNGDNRVLPGDEEEVDQTVAVVRATLRVGRQRAVTVRIGQQVQKSLKI